MRQLILSKDADGFIEKLGSKQKGQIAGRIFKLLSNPLPHDSQSMKGSDFLRLDQGEYRILYLYDDKTVTVTYVGKRNDDEVYKEFKRGQG